MSKLLTGRLRWAVAWALCGAASPAAAQLGIPAPTGTNSTTPAGNVTITGSRLSSRSAGPARPGSARQAISYADCMRTENPWSLDIDVKVTNQQGTLELWAGDGCEADATRSMACRRIPSAQVAPGVHRVTAPDIMGALGIQNCVDPSGNTKGHTLKLNFLLAGSPEEVRGRIDAANVASLSIDIDLLGPMPPPERDVAVDPMDGMLKITLPANVDPDTKSFYVFMYPNPKPARQARSCAGNMGAMVERAPTCPPSISLPCVDPAHPSSESPAFYDQVFSRGSSLVLQGLTNDQPHMVAIAGVDALGNVGRLSALECAAPRETDTYFEQYCRDGGNACDGGCGTCQTGAHPAPAWRELLAATATVGLVVWRRRRTRSKRRNGAAR